MSFGFGFGFTKITAAIRAAFSPSSLFATNEPGVWYDPSDPSTLYQDAAGTTPVTAVEQPVGLILDKSGNGNHAYQTTATSRPVLSARYNLLTKTEQFDDASVWTKTNVTATPNAAVAPDGTLTADKLVEAATSGFHYLSTYVSGSESRKFSIFAKAGERKFITIGQPARYGLGFDLTDGTFAVASGPFQGLAGAEPAGNGWWNIWMTDASIASVQIFPATSKTTYSYTGDGTSGIYIWGASLVPVNQADLPYQRVNTMTDYDADPAKFPHYLRFDGVDDWLVTNTITPETDKVQVFAGVRKLNNTPGLIYGHGPNTNVTAGSFEVLSTGWSEAASRYGAALNISLLSRADSPTDFAPPRSDVLNWAFDASGSTLSDEIKLRVNGTLQTLSMSDPTQSGNFTTQIGYIGRRAGAWLSFYGHLYSLIVRFGPNLPIATIEKTEKYINTKTRAY